MIELGATDFNTAMEDAALGGHREIIELMIGHNATDFNETMIKVIRSRGTNIQQSKDIINRMVELGATNFNQGLVKAVERGKHPIVDQMIAHGANNFEEAIVAATEEGYLALADYLRRRKG